MGYIPHELYRVMCCIVNSNCRIMTLIHYMPCRHYMHGLDHHDRAACPDYAPLSFILKGNYQGADLLPLCLKQNIKNI